MEIATHHSSSINPALRYIERGLNCLAKEFRNRNCQDYHFSNIFNHKHFYFEFLKSF